MKLKTLLTLALVLGLAGFGVSQATAKFTAGTVQNQGAERAIKDSYIVIFKKDAVPSDKVNERANDVAKKHGGKVNKRYTAALRGFSAQMTEQQARNAAKDPNVDYIEQDATVTASAIQNNPTWGLNRIDQRAPINTYVNDTAASGVKIYILDSGIRISHTDFGGRASYGYDFIGNDSVASDCNGHGTHVAGTAGSKTYGVAKAASLVAVRVLDCNGSGSWSGVLAGIDWVTKNHVKPAVANMSLGGGASTAINDAVRNSIVAGITYAVAAGNNNADACTKSPASAPEALTVGNVTNTDTRSSSSNYGSCLDIWAPGTNIVSTSYSGDTATATMSGTSMASPHVAGAAAMLLANDPTLTPQQISNVLAEKATVNGVKNAMAGSPNRMLFVGDISSPQVVKATYCNNFTSTADVTINDLQTVSSPLGISGCSGAASTETKVAVDIKHTYRGELVIDLVAPDGSAYRLKNASTTDSADNLNETYTLDLSGEARNGTWQLKVYDRDSGDTGYIDSWSIKL